MVDVVVIGGGIVGASAAYRLARQGVAVTLIDQAAQGQATAAGAGIISPGTSTRPLPAFYPLAFQSVAYYEELLANLAEDGETRTGYEIVGLLHIATSEEQAAQLPGLLHLFEQRRDAGVKNIGKVELLQADEARRRFPPLGALHGAISTSEGARMDGRLMRDALQHAAQRHGARFLTGTAELLLKDGKISAVQASGQQLAPDAIIIAGGAWSGALAEALHLKLPVYPQRGQILHLALPDAEAGRWPIIVGFHSHYLLTFPPNRVVVGATREDGPGFDPRLTAGGVQEVLSEALRVAPGLANASLHEMRVGLRPASPDGLPILGRAPGYERVFIATGHGPSGLQLGPYSGALVADLLLGKPTPLDLTPFAPERFRNISG
jgi:D-amino-acid dehydrogenase